MQNEKNYALHKTVCPQAHSLVPFSSINMVLHSVYYFYSCIKDLSLFLILYVNFSFLTLSIHFIFCLTPHPQLDSLQLIVFSLCLILSSHL